MGLVAWLKDSAIRALKTFGQAAGGAIVIDQATPLHSNFTFAVQIGLAAAVLSLLNNLAALEVGKSDPAPAVGEPGNDGEDIGVVEVSDPEAGLTTLELLGCLILVGVAVLIYLAVR